MARCAAGGAETLAALMVLLLLLRTAGASTLEESVQREEGVLHIVYMGAAASRGGGLQQVTAASGGSLRVKAATQAQARARHRAMLAAITGNGISSLTATGESSSGGADAVPTPRLVYSYSKSFEGFAAVLTPAQAASARSMAGVARVFPSRLRHLHTTRSWNFLGMQDNGEEEHDGDGGSNHGNGTVVGLLDSGVWPESASFRDDGMAPVPLSWRGVCEGGEDWNASRHCNRKIIGARFYYQGMKASMQVQQQQEGADDGMLDEIMSVRDTEGHGTHTASTAVGRVVPGASEFGLGGGSGAARGGAPLARLAVYKVCWRLGCSDADILAAMDDAVADGVDVLSMSFGLPPPLPQFFHDPLSLGSFHALQAGILVVTSAGNDGPDPGSVTNVGPWNLNVAATSLDREFATVVTLGDNRTLVGSSLSPRETGWRPLLYAGDAGLNNSGLNSSFCRAGSLDPAKVAGAIVVCLLAKGDGAGMLSARSEVVRNAGGAGFILVYPWQTQKAPQTYVFLLPTAVVDVRTGDAILSYIRSIQSGSSGGGGTSATARLERTAVVDGVAQAPLVAVFSSRGPNSLNPGILKPDLAAPGVNILASWSPLWPPSDLSRASDPRAVPFHVVSGTSMSCPHGAGSAARVRSLRPDLGPAAIKSALMTTASVLDNTGAPMLADRVASSESGALAAASPLDYGAGQIDPSRAADPGLVYDAGPADFVRFLCSMGGGGYNTTHLRIVTGNDTDECPPVTDTTNSGGSGGVVADLNYPSITVTQAALGNVTVTRTATYVGRPPLFATSSLDDADHTSESAAVEFTATVQEPAGVRIAVVPDRLVFSDVGEEQSFRLLLAVEELGPGGSWAFGALVWSDGLRTVRSPISIGF